MMKWQGRSLEQQWQKTCGESDKTHNRAHYKAFSVVVVTIFFFWLPLQKATQWNCIMLHGVYSTRPLQLTRRNT